MRLIHILLIILGPLTFGTANINIRKFTQSKTAATTLTMTYGGAVASNPDTWVSFVVVATNNINGTTDGDFSDVTSVVDDAGHTYIKGAEYTNGQGGAANGATVSVWYATLSNTLTTSNVITVTFNGSPDARSMGNGMYPKSTGTLVTHVAATTSAVDGAAPATMSVTGLTSREYLFIRASAIEAPPVLAGQSSGWIYWVRSTETASSGTSGGGAATNMSLFFETQVATGTGTSSNSIGTNAGSSGDNASVILPLYEYTPAPLTRRVFLF